MAKNIKKTETQPEHEKGILREWILPLATALVAAFLIKWMIFDVYSIPTGSMEPTLFGKPHGGDRVFCNKLSYLFRSKHQPYRWETFVFKYPGGGKHAGDNYIKRCVGLPDETLYIVDGDIYTRPPLGTHHLQQKPLDLQDSIWIPIYAESFSNNNKAALNYYWQKTEVDGNWNLKKGKLHGQTTSAIHLRYKPIAGERELTGIPDRHVKRQVVTFICPQCQSKTRKTVQTQQLTTFCIKCNHFLSEKNIDSESFTNPGLDFSFIEGNFAYANAKLKRGTPFNIISDLRLTLQIRPYSDNGNLNLEIFNNEYACKVVLALGKKAAVQLLLNGKPVKQQMPAINLQTNKAVQLDFFRVDGRVVLRLDGKQVFLYQLKLPYDIDRFTSRSGIIISLENGSVALDNLKIYRDLHYFDEYGRFHKIPKGNYMALGDNSPTSNDSRSWGFVPKNNLIGPALFIWWPLHRIRIIK